MTDSSIEKLKSYILMHKNIAVCDISINLPMGNIIAIKEYYNVDHLPIAY